MDAIYPLKSYRENHRDFYAVQFFFLQEFSLSFDCFVNINVMHNHYFFLMNQTWVFQYLYYKSMFYYFHLVFFMIINLNSKIKNFTYYAF